MRASLCSDFSNTVRNVRVHVQEHKRLRGIAETWSGKQVEHGEPSEARSGVFYSTAIEIHREQKHSTSLCYLVPTGSVQTGRLN